MLKVSNFIQKTVEKLNIMLIYEEKRKNVFGALVLVFISTKEILKTYWIVFIA